MQPILETIVASFVRPEEQCIRLLSEQEAAAFAEREAQIAPSPRLRRTTKSTPFDITGDPPKKPYSFARDVMGPLRRKIAADMAKLNLYYNGFDDEWQRRPQPKVTLSDPFDVTVRKVEEK